MARGAAPSELPSQQEPQDAIPQGNAEPGEDGFIPQETVKDSRKGPFLVGRSDVGTNRRVTEADFRSVGIDCRTLEFKWQDGYKLPLDSVPAEAAEFLVNHEYGFSISDE